MGHCSTPFFLYTLGPEKFQKNQRQTSCNYLSSQKTISSFGLVITEKTCTQNSLQKSQNPLYLGPKGRYQHQCGHLHCSLLISTFCVNFKLLGSVVIRETCAQVPSRRINNNNNLEGRNQEKYKNKKIHHVMVNLN